MQTNDRIAAAAAAQFHEHGITSTGVDALSRAAGISKRTLYERFGSKDGLIVAAYESLDIPVFQMFTGAAEAAADTPRGQLEALFAQLEVMVGMPEFRGCPFANAAAELADLDHPAHQVVRAHKQRLRDWMEERARLAGAADPDALSRQADAGVRRRAVAGAGRALAAAGRRRPGARRRAAGRGASD